MTVLPFFEVCISGHTIVISDHILTEVKNALLKKLKLPRETIRDLSGYLREIAETVKPDHIDASVCRDKEDLPVIIGTAIKGKADFIITGDGDLLVTPTTSQVCRAETAAGFREYC